MIITRESSSIIKGSPSIVDPFLYDSRGKDPGGHFAIQVTLDCSKQQHSKKEITFRRHCAISLSDFIEDIKSSATLLCTSCAVDNLVEAYYSGVKVLINKHAPLQRKTITLRPNAPWYTEELQEEKHNCRKAERK